MPKISALEVIETGARRRWTLEEKQRIVAESFSSPRVVSATARRHGLSTSQLFNWRRMAREGKLIPASAEPEFVPAVVAPDVPCDSVAVEMPSRSPEQRGVKPGSGQMVIVLSPRRQVVVSADVDAAALRRVLEVLEER